MKVYNVKNGGSLKNVIISSMTLILVISIYIFLFWFAGCKSFTDVPYLIADFYSSAIDSGISNLITVIVIFIIFPLISILYFILSIKLRQKSLKEYWDFLPGRIDFCYPIPQENFSLSYSDIKNINFIINSEKVKTKNGSYIEVNNVITQIILKDNEKLYEIESSDGDLFSLIINIVSYSRSVENITYEFLGEGDPDDWGEKLDNYINYGYKDIFGTNQFNMSLGLSLLLSFIGSCFLYSLNGKILNWNLVEDYWGIFLLIFILSAVSIFIDILLIIDKERDYKFELSRGNINNRSILCRNFIISYLVIKMIIYFSFYYIVK